MRLITDNNWRDVEPEFGVSQRRIVYGSDEARDHGMTPFSDRLDRLIPWDDMEERIKEANARKQMPIHYLEASNAQPHSQGGTNYCWAYGIAMCLEALRPIQNLPYHRLGPASLGWIVNWRNKGNYLSSAIKGAMERGIARSDLVPDGTNNPRVFKTGWQDDALNNKPLEFTDLDHSGERFMAQQCASMLILGCPLYIAFTWWGHALASMGVIWDTSCKYNLRWVNWNSHSDGRLEMTGSKGVPDEAHAVRVATVSP